MIDTAAKRFDPHATLRQLEQVDIFRYFKNRGMPPGIETLISQLLAWLRIVSGTERISVLQAATPKSVMPLGWYARKAAGLSVRMNSVAILHDGVLALLLSTIGSSQCDSLPPLSLLYRSAVLLGVDARAVFAEQMQFCDNIGSDVVRTFLSRPDIATAFETFKFSEGEGPEGFDYLPLLPEFGGPTPF
jgi:hypothetical protein